MLCFYRLILSWYHKKIKNFLQLARHDDKEARINEILSKKEILKCIQTLYGFQRADVRGLELEIWNFWILTLKFLFLEQNFELKIDIKLDPRIWFEVWYEKLLDQKFDLIFELF